MNKKATISSALVDFVSYGIFILVIIVMTSFLTFSAKERFNAVKSSDFLQIESKTALLNYLNTPLDYGTEQISMAEYITLAVNDKEVITLAGEIQLKKINEKYPRITGILNDYLKYTNGCYILQIKKTDNSIFDFPNVGACRADLFNQAKPVLTPSLNGDIAVKLIIGGIK